MTDRSGDSAHPKRQLAMSSALDIKRALKDAGLEVYRTRGDVVQLAERVRENLLMDAQIFVRAPAAPTCTTPASD